MGHSSTVHLHVPTPGDHYSAITGSAIMTVIYEIARAHAVAGGSSLVAVSNGTRHDYPTGECIVTGPTSGYPARWARGLDAVAGRVGLPRTFSTKPYRATLQAVSNRFDGVVFLHNAPAAVRSFRRSYPHARICLWACNELFRTYSDRETQRVVDACDRVICCSHHIAHGLSRRLRHGSERVVVVHHGVDAERFRPRALPDRQESPAVILSVARAVPNKGADLLLTAAGILRRRRAGVPPFVVRLVGGDGFVDHGHPLSPFERRLRQLAEPIQECVEFRPSVDRYRVVDEYQSASIFCAPYTWDDPFPLAVLEAMACGLPAVASHRGGIPEIGSAIQYFRPPDAEELADRLRLLLADRNARDTWAASARATAKTFSWQRAHRALCEAIDGPEPHPLVPTPDHGLADQGSAAKRIPCAAELSAQCVGSR